MTKTSKKRKSAHSVKNVLVTVGLMSGTSMDGIDAALLLTDGEGQVQSIGSASLTYSSHFRTLLKAAEMAVSKANGDLRLARKNYNKVLQDYVSVTSKIPKTKIGKALEKLKKSIGGKKGGSVEFNDVINHSTDLHAEVVKKLLTKTKYESKQIDLIGYHGQTLFHLPSNRITIQAGNGQRLADKLQIPVVYDFRSNDVAHGGQGAPFAPLYHMALAKQSSLQPVAIVNCGGISNLTIIPKRDEDIFAYDAGPGNTLLDRFVRNKVGKEMDQNGRFAKAGKINKKALIALRKRGVTYGKGENFLTLAPPKSLDSSNLHLVSELKNLSIQDACRTLAAFTADCMVRSLKFITKRGIKLPKLWIVAGGGWQNPVILSEFEEQLREEIGPSLRVKHADDVGWSGKALEAEIFAYLGVRSVRKLPLSVPGTTRVPKPLSGGKLVFPGKNRKLVSPKLAKYLR